MIEAGLVKPVAGVTTMRIWMAKTDSLCRATVQTSGAVVTYAGDTACSGVPGTAFVEVDVIGKKTINANAVSVIPMDELDGWVKLGDPVADAWTSDASAKGENGEQIDDGAKALIGKHSAAK